jgi:hypothetical protein
LLYFCLTLVSFLAYSSTLKIELLYPPKNPLTFNGLHGVIPHKTELFISIIVTISNPESDYISGSSDSHIPGKLDVSDYSDDIPHKKNSVALVRKRTIPTERPPLVGEVSANPRPLISVF